MHRASTWRLWTVTAVAAALVAAGSSLVVSAQTITAAAPAPPSAVPTFATGACPFPLPEKLAAGSGVECGTVSVLLHRSAPDKSSSATLSTVILRAGSARTKGAVFHLIGGPGGSAEAFLPVLKDFAALARTTGRDVVLVDQRGTGYSKPFLDCDEDFAAAQASGGNPRSACVARLSAQGIDPADFTPAAIADDIDDVRRALKYGRIDVWGQSAGSYLAQEYARRHPGSVRSLLLESVDTGPSSLARPSGFNAALDRMFSACARERRCATRNPELDRRLAQTFARLTKQPLRTAAGPLNGAGFIAAVEQSLEFAAGTVVTADLITAAHRRDATTVNAVLAQLAAGPDIAGPFSAVMNELVNCAQVQGYATAESVVAANVGIRPEIRAVIVPAVLSQYVTNCSQWDVTFPADAAGVPQPTTVPTLVINGDMDPNTALDNARTVASYSRTVQTVAFAGYGHLIAVRGDGCGLAVYASFLRAPGKPVNRKCVPTTIRFRKPAA